MDGSHPQNKAFETNKAGYYVLYIWDTTLEDRDTSRVSSKGFLCQQAGKGNKKWQSSKGIYKLHHCNLVGHRSAIIERKKALSYFYVLAMLSKPVTKLKPASANLQKKPFTFSSL